MLDEVHLGASGSFIGIPIAVVEMVAPEGAIEERQGFVMTPDIVEAGFVTGTELWIFHELSPLSRLGNRRD
jgi:hypothetical protein